MRVRGGQIEATCDGLGWLLGDGGSGFWIGHRAVLAATQRARRPWTADGPRSTSFSPGSAWSGPRNAATAVARSPCAGPSMPSTECARSNSPASHRWCSRPRRSATTWPGRIIAEAADALAATLGRRRGAGHHRAARARRQHPFAAAIVARRVVADRCTAPMRIRRSSRCPMVSSVPWCWPCARQGARRRPRVRPRSNLARRAALIPADGYEWPCGSRTRRDARRGRRRSTARRCCARPRADRRPRDRPRGWPGADRRRRHRGPPTPRGA